MDSIYDIEVQPIGAEPIKLSLYQGKVLLIVNVASQCGFTPQYEGLQALYEKYKDRGLVVLGFPCNQFGRQEPGTEAEIKTFCETKYHVTFPLFTKIEVIGDKAHPLYQYLTNMKPGLLGIKAIKWNFTKFLINRQGEVVERFAPLTKPEELVDVIERTLG